MNRIAFFLLILLCSCQKVDQKNPIQTTQDTTKVENPLLVRLKNLDRLIEKNPKDAALFAERAHIQYTLGDSSKMMDDINQALFRDPNDVEYAYLKGFYFYNYNQIDSAYFWFKQAWNNKSENPEVPYQLGNIMVLRKKYGDALRWFDKAIEKEGQANYYYARALVHKELKNIPMCKIEAELALKKDKKHIKTLSLLFELALEENDKNKALAWNHEIEKADSMHPVWLYNQGLMYFKQGQEQKKANKKVESEGMFRIAIDFYTKAIARSPKYVNAYYDRGYAFFEIEEYDLAAKSFEKVIEMNPTDFRAYFMMGSISEYYDDPQMAKTYYQKSLERKPDFKDAQMALRELK